jgi:hypothetical protein
VTPVITEVIGTSSKSFINYLSKVLGEHKIKELQQRALLGSEHILQKVLIYKYKTFSWKELLHIHEV